MAIDLWPGSSRGQVISSHNNDLVFLETEGWILLLYYPKCNWISYLYIKRYTMHIWYVLLIKYKTDNMRYIQSIQLSKIIIIFDYVSNNQRSYIFLYTVAISARHSICANFLDNFSSCSVIAQFSWIRSCLVTPIVATEIWVNIASGNVFYLMAPGHYLNQCLLLNEVLWHSTEGNFTSNAHDILYNEFEKTIQFQMDLHQYCIIVNMRNVSLIQHRP